MLTDNIRQMLTDRYPFITVCLYSSDEYVGIVQNRDTQVTTLYDFGAIQCPLAKQRFIEYGAVWWWESNRSIPINIFLKRDWEEFRPILRTFVNKDLTVVHGPVTSLADLATQRSKRRFVTLVRKA